jgi:hypothetical protein
MFRKRHGMSFTQRTQRRKEGFRPVGPAFALIYRTPTQVLGSALQVSGLKLPPSSDPSGATL